METNLSYINKIPSFEEAQNLCSYPDSPFYESKLLIDGYRISAFNYRLAEYEDFLNPLPDKPYLKGFEMRGLTFVFNEDGTLFNRYILLHKFFNLNQVDQSLYSVVKNYKIKYINNKEDGSIASFIKLPNGKIIGKTKMGFDNDQANGINRIYNNNRDIKSFVDWCFANNLMPIFEYVSPRNKIVLRYSEEDLILIRLRDNITGDYLDVRNYVDRTANIKIAPFEEDIKDLDQLIEINKNKVNKEGSIVTCQDEFGRDFFFKIKTPWYLSLHGLLTEDIYRENVLIQHILNEQIDDILSKIPEDQVEDRIRINKIIHSVKGFISHRLNEIESEYENHLKSGLSKKDYAIQNMNNRNFPFVINMINAQEGKNSIKKKSTYEMLIEWVANNTKKLGDARNFLQNLDSSFQFKNEINDDN